MVATKGYGLSVDDIDWSSPADMKPYLKAHEEEIKEQDYFAWLFNQYTLSAVLVAVEHCLAGKKAKSEYVKKPIMKEVEDKQTKNKLLTEEDKKKQTEKLFMQLRIMGANFNLNHKEENKIDQKRN